MRFIVGGDRGLVNFSVTCNVSSIPGLSPSQVFLSPSDARNNASRAALTNLTTGGNIDVGKQVAFLSYASKSLAGGFRFLTCAAAQGARAHHGSYFGRDTSVASRTRV